MGKQAARTFPDKEVNYKMAVSSQISSPNSIQAKLLLVLCFAFSFKVDGNLLVDPALIGKELQAFAKDALGVDEMQVSLR